MTAEVSASRLADVVRRRMATSSSEVNVYWMRITEGRDDYAARLRAELGDQSAVVVVIRDQRFTNPNMVLSDLLDLILDERHACEKQLNSSSASCAFVLLARTDLAIAHSSSPVALPSWFPIGGGTTVSTCLEDLTWSAEAPLDAAEVRIGELSEYLLDLESVLVFRIRETLVLDHRKTNAFLDLVRRDPSETVETILDGAWRHHAGITTPTGYRPSRRDGRALVARLWSVCQTTEPDQLTQPCKALASALRLPETLHGVWYESLSSVLRRPVGGERSEPLRFSRNLLFSIGTTCQLITAAAHEDDYSHYAVALLRSVSLDLRQSLVDCEAILRSLGQGQD